ncbi:hypothetical protein BM1374166_01363 [Bartonella tribocorum]|nr:hypothetical protein BM1374166_01363 [Bartonella tribocorum]
MKNSRLKNMKDKHDITKEFRMPLLIKKEVFLLVIYN